MGAMHWGFRRNVERYKRHHSARDRPNNRQELEPRHSWQMLAVALVLHVYGCLQYRYRCGNPFTTFVIPVLVANVMEEEDGSHRHANYWR